jgi:hypothetical protein
MSFADGTPLTTAATADISPGALASPKVIPPHMADIGTVLRLRAFGIYSATTGAATIGTLGFCWGGTTLAGGPLWLAATNTTLLTTTTGAASWPWWMEYEGEFRGVGVATSSITGYGKLRWPTSLTAWAEQPIPQTAAGRTLALTGTSNLANTTLSQPVTVGATWSSATGSPSITCNHLSVELIG